MNISHEYFNKLSNFLIFNNFLFQNIIFQQIKGIPQGSSVLSMLPDLSIYYSEKDHINCNPLEYLYIDYLYLFKRNELQYLY